MKDKYLPYGHQWIDDEDVKEVVKVLKGDWITQGPKIKEFEDAVCKYTGAKYAVAVSSGTAALHCACLAAGIKKGDEVITSPITFVASANCVLYCGGRPVFVDIQEDTINIDPEKIEEYLRRQKAEGRGQKVKAIIPVDFAGQPADLIEIHKIAQKYNLIVIEDASHALGAEYQAKSKWAKIGNGVHSHMAVFSFHPVKPITTGEGGMVVTNRKDLYEKLLMFRNHGITKINSQFAIHNSQLTGPWYYEMQELGYNYRITDFQCALGISQLRKLDKFIERRREIVREYNEAFKDVEEIITPYEKPAVKSAWHIYVVRLKLDKLKATRKEIFEALRRENIGVQVHYIPVYYHPYYQKLGYKKGLCPKAEKYYEEAITLPLFPAMTDRDVKDVIRAVRKVIGYFRK